MLSSLINSCRLVCYTRRCHKLVKSQHQRQRQGRSPNNMLVQKILVAFDFDHTLIDDNSDLYVRKLAPNGHIPAHIKALYNDDGWTKYMGAIFEYLHLHKVTPKQILDCMRELTFVDGITELLQYLSQDQFESIIISDANSVFIDCILKNQGQLDVFSQVYTNPAWFSDDGCLILQQYHTQDWCDLSTVNLCKGHILEEHIEKGKEQGIQYSTVVYVGDGSNDLCPSLRLQAKDFVLPRVGYSLLKKIQELDNDSLKARVVPWTTGHDILKVMQNLLNPSS